jgi:hypothetical protein
VSGSEEGYVVDSVKESQLFDDLKAGHDGAFADHLNAIPWEERAAYAKQVKSDLDTNRSQDPTLPELTLDIQPYKDMRGESKEYVNQIKAVEERSWFNPSHWWPNSNRTAPYEIYSPTLREKLNHGVAEFLQIERKVQK